MQRRPTTDPEAQAVSPVHPIPPPASQSASTSPESASKHRDDSHWAHTGCCADTTRTNTTVAANAVNPSFENMPSESLVARRRSRRRAGRAPRARPIYIPRWKMLGRTRARTRVIVGWLRLYRRSRRRPVDGPERMHVGRKAWSLPGIRRRCACVAALAGGSGAGESSVHRCAGDSAANRG